MLPKSFHHLPASLLAFVAAGAAAQLPYNPTRIISNTNGTFAYVFAPDISSSQFSLSLLNTSSTVNSSNVLSTLYSTLPFLSSATSKAFIPVADDQGEVTILAGDCRNSAQGLELWTFTPTEDYKNGSWSNLQVTLYDATLAANYLSAGFSFSPNNSAKYNGVYVFGGMCPQTETTQASDWTLDATYSNTMLTISPDSNAANTSKVPYDLSMTGQRAPPIAEAGLTITPLMATYANTSNGTVSQQQNFVLIGGHTSNAFINMSQVALFSLPEQSWSFLGINQPVTSGSTDLLTRDDIQVEPRSGHTATMSPDGSRIIVFGGWVGDINTPASPQLAVLEVGQGYGGMGDWAWSIPSQVSSPFASGQGIYGHGAAMLPGGVMMVNGGFKITASGSKVKRAANDVLLFNTTSYSWIESYSNPNSPTSPNYVASPSGSSSSKMSSKTIGLGAGLGIGAAAVIGILTFWFFYRRRLRKQRTAREKELRELALGAERYHSGSLVGGGMDGRGGYPEMRTASWGNRQEQMMENNGDYPWAPVITQEQAGRLGLGPVDGSNGLHHAERTGLLMEIPSPTRGLRRSLHSRGPQGYGGGFGAYPGGAPPVFRIDEEEEGSQPGSLRRAKTPKRDAANRASDPFKDPVSLPDSRPATAAEERKKEVQGWVEDWRAAEDAILSRSPSKATTHGRTYSNLSNSQSNSHSGESGSGRGSPDKSDRTESNLSERSMMSNYSFQRSQAGTISRNVSQRSAGTGYAIFAGAAAAMAARVRGEPREPSQQNRPAAYGTVNTGTASLSRAPSKRSTSLNLNSTSSSQGHPHPRERSETFSSARTSTGPILAGEDHLLLRTNSRAATDEKDYWATPPESPVKKSYRADSFGSQAGRKALGLLGSVKRVFTGTGSVDVQDRVAALEERSGQSSPTKRTQGPEMAEAPRRTVSAGAAFWRGKQGARDWDHHDDSGVGSSGTIRRKPVPGPVEDEGSEDGDWDVETAIQQRVVQVMFTVPKEKLRVVNADALSLMSKSDVDFEEEREKEIKRMSSVREGDEVEPEVEPQRVVVTADNVQVEEMTVEEVEVGDDGADIKGKGKQKYVFEV